VVQFPAVHVKVKDNRGSFVSDLAVWESEAVVVGADPGSEAEGTPLELCRTVEGRRECDKESRIGGGRRSRKILGWAMRSTRNGSMTAGVSARERARHVKKSFQLRPKALTSSSKASSKDSTILFDQPRELKE
jgi:hypothetical protein